MTWDDPDDDVPSGSVGEITGPFDEEGEPEWYVQFPNGEWHFPVAQLRFYDSADSSGGVFSCAKFELRHFPTND